MPEAVKETKEKVSEKAFPRLRTSQEVMQALEAEHVIAIVRTSIFENVEAISEAVIAGGIRAVAISVAVPQCFRFIETLSARYPDVVVGACHAFDGEQAQKAIEAGAKFISSAFIAKDIISVCRNSGILAIQGAQTPTEVMEALRSGADMVQIFPAGLSGGPLYIRALKEPLPTTKFVASGGVTLENVVDFIKAGSAVVMVDDAISDRGLIRDNKWNDISERAKLFAQKIASLKATK